MNEPRLCRHVSVSVRWINVKTSDALRLITPAAYCLDCKLWLPAHEPQADRAIERAWEALNIHEEVIYQGDSFRRNRAGI